MKTLKTYDELIRLSSFEDRFEYLKLIGKVGVDTFGSDRYLNQVLYNSYEWRKVRRRVIIRDNGCDLAHPDHILLDKSKILVHHMNPITVEQVLDRDPDIFNENYLITTSALTHEAIHYSNIDLLPKGIVERFPNDMAPWLL